MNANRKSQDELIEEANTLAAKAKGNHRIGESYIIESNARLIESNARVEGQISNLISTLKSFNVEATLQTEKLIKLTKSIEAASKKTSEQTEKLTALTGSIENAGKEASKQAKILTWLTWAIVILTLMLTVDAVMPFIERIAR